MPETQQAKPPDVRAAWDRATGYLDKLFDALQDLDEAGGVPAMARAAGWKPARLDQAVRSLKAVRGQLDAELARVKASRTKGV